MVAAGLAFLIYLLSSPRDAANLVLALGILGGGGAERGDQLDGVRADLAFELIGGAGGHDLAAVDDRQPVGVLGLVREVGGQEVKAREGARV